MRKLSGPQLRMLEDIGRTGNPWTRVFGQSAFGGATATLRSLESRKLVFRKGPQSGFAWALTDTGATALRERGS